MLDYDEQEAAAIQSNLRDLQGKLARGTIDKGLNIKIENFSRRFGLEPELVRLKLLYDDLFLLSFIKAPGRQSFHQRLAFDYLRSLPGVCAPQVLPPSGVNAKFVVQGAVLPYSQYKDTSASTKSIDFEWKIQRPDNSWVTCFATHKFTGDEGGSQDNQFKDVQDFMKQAGSCVAEHLFFFAICDGPYYQRPQQHQATRIDYLNTQFGRSRSKAVTINTLLQHLQTI